MVARSVSLQEVARHILREPDLIFRERSTPVFLTTSGSVKI